VINLEDNECLEPPEDLKLYLNLTSLLFTSIFFTSFVVLYFHVWVHDILGAVFNLLTVIGCVFLLHLRNKIKI
jgi:hypothetical protein